MLKLTETYSGNARLPEDKTAYLYRLYCPKCDSKRSKPCECRQKSKPNITNPKGDLP